MVNINELFDMNIEREAKITSESFRLSEFETDSTPGLLVAKNAKEVGAELFSVPDAEVADLQERMYAHARVGDKRAPSVLFILQGMDTAGKGGIIRHVFGSVDPQGLMLASFGKPTEKELAHDFLWRVRKRLPRPGYIGVFDRSHYEDVLIQRVHQLVDNDEVERRYDAIVDFEAELAEQNIHVVKVFLHVSKQVQKERLYRRLHREDKLWKFDPSDISERDLWDEYQHAYELAIQRNATPVSPWWIVPADRKWFVRLFVKGLLLKTLRGLELQWPQVQFDSDEQLRRLAAS